MYRVALLAVLFSMISVSGAAAQQRPLLTEDPETVGSGIILIEGGFDHQRGIEYPVSGLTGNLTRIPTLGLSIGVGPIAELQFDGGLVNRLRVTAREPAPLSGELTFTGDMTTDIEDFVVGTKIRLVSEAPGRPSFAVRFATKLPNASTESGLGLDTIDFYASVLGGKTVESIRIVGNAGLGILTDPTRGFRQNDVLTYGVSLARAVRQGVEVVGEINGRINLRDHDVPVGTETRSVLRAGARATRGTLRVDGALLIGLTSRDPTVGFTAGLTWVFRAFTMP